MKHNNENKVHNPLQSVSWQYKLRIVEAKKAREQLGGKHHPKEQCNGMPGTFAENGCIHLESCYKKFTLILAGQSTRQSKDEGLHYGSLSEKYLPGLIPMFAISVKNHAYDIKKVTPVTITSFQAQKTIKAAAKAKEIDIMKWRIFIW